jgi:hypothetical protein
MDRTVELSEVLGKIDELLQQGVGEPSGEANLFGSAAAATPGTPAIPSPPKEKSAPPPAPVRTETRVAPSATPAPAARQDERPVVGDNLRERILDRIRKHSTVIAGFMTNARIVRGEGGAVDVTVYGGNGYIQKQLAQKSNANVIQAEVAAEMGRGLHVRLHVDSGPPPGQKTATKPARKPANDDSLLQSDEKLRMIVERFEAEIVPEER